MRRFLFILLMVTALTGIPGTAFAEIKTEETFTDQDRLRDEASENYDAAKDQLQNIYYDALDRMTDEGGMLSGEPMDEWIYRQFYRFYILMRDSMVFCIMFCELLGIAIFVVSRKNKKFQRFALFGLMIGIPLFIVLFVYGIGASPLFRRL